MSNKPPAVAKVSIVGVLWVILFLVALGVMLRSGIEYLGTIQGSHTICGTVPSYGPLQFDSQEETIGLVLQPNAAVPLEPLFCAQYELAPRVIVGVGPLPAELWSALERGPVILDSPNTRDLETALNVLVREKTGSNLKLQRQEYSNGLLLLRLKQ